MTMMSEFKEFAMRGSVLDLAIGVVIGGAFGKNLGLDAATLDVDAYVAGKAMDGLFKVVAEEEKRIRENPAARTTDLLKQVFGAVKK